MILSTLAVAVAALVVLAAPSAARTAGPFTVSEASYDFGAVPVGSEASHHFTVTNTGSTIAMLNFRTSNGIGSFTVRNDGCLDSATLAGGASCGFDVVFAPLVQDELTGSEVYHYDIGLATVELDGTGAAAGNGGPPVVTVPGDMSTDANTPAGRSVDFKVTARDWLGQSLTPTCDHAPGWTFPVGTTAVTCSARDSGGATATGTFSVSVRSAADQLSALSAAVAALNLGGGLGTVLRNELADTAKKLGNPAEACVVLSTFTGQVIAKTPEKLTIVQAEQLLVAVNMLQQALGCLPPDSPVPGAELDLLELAQAIDAMGLSAGETTLLETKSYGAAKSLAEGQRAAACASLDDFVAQVARDSGKKGKLTAVQAATLAGAVAVVRGALGC